MQPAHRTRRFPVSAIRQATRMAQAHDALNLAQGFPDDPPPPELVAALRRLDARHHQYSNTWGYRPLRNGLSKLVSQSWGMPVDPAAQLTITCGVTEAVVAALFATVDPGEEVILLAPMHENYLPAVVMAEAVPRVVNLEPPDYRLDPERLRAAASPKTRALILNTPHNPTGHVCSKEELDALAAVCRERDMVLITDEIYEHLVFTGRHIPPGSLPGMRERTIATGGLSKILSVTGWRLGYAVAPPALTAALRKVHEYMTICAPTPLQVAASRALDGLPARAAGMRAAYRQRRDLFVSALQRCGFACKRPQGAYYAWANIRELELGRDTDVVEFLVREAGIASVPGSSFYPQPDAGDPGSGNSPGSDYIRFAFCKQEATLNEAIERLEALLVSSRNS